MFPDGWPGGALLLLRVVAGIVLIHDGVAALVGTSRLQIIVMQSVAVGAGTLLLIGLWTPIAGVLVVVVEIWSAFSGTSNLESSFLLATLGAALAALGPGFRSIDARLFGRKRIDIRDR
jgi:putative oxidoreductase